jgi:hypothetical protein
MSIWITLEGLNCAGKSYVQRKLARDASNVETIGHFRSVVTQLPNRSDLRRSLDILRRSVGTDLDQHVAEQVTWAHLNRVKMAYIQNRMETASVLVVHRDLISMLCHGVTVFQASNIHRTRFLELFTQLLADLFPSPVLGHHTCVFGVTPNQFRQRLLHRGLKPSPFLLSPDYCKRYLSVLGGICSCLSELATWHRSSSFGEWANVVAKGCQRSANPGFAHQTHTRMHGLVARAEKGLLHGPYPDEAEWESPGSLFQWDCGSE